MTKLGVMRTVFDAMLFPLKNYHALARRLGIAAALSLVGTWVIAFVQTKNASIQADQVDTSNWLYWVGAALLTVGSVMITNGAIQVRLKNPTGQKFWSLGNTEISQFAISVFGIILIVVIGVFLMITYWFVSLVLGASFGVESGDNTNAKFFVLAIVSVFLVCSSPFGLHHCQLTFLTEICLRSRPRGERRVVTSGE